MKQEISSKLQTELKKARKRKRHGRLCGYVYGYCGNQRCDAREVEVHIKESYGPPHIKQLLCPACGEPLEHIGVETMAENKKRHDAYAIGSVNIQLIKRDDNTGSYCASDLIKELPDEWKPVRSDRG